MKFGLESGLTCFCVLSVDLADDLDGEGVVVPVQHPFVDVHSGGVGPVVPVFHPDLKYNLSF